MSSLRAHLEAIKRWDRLAIATGLLLILCLVIGGASQRHALRLFLLEIAALPVLGLAIRNLAERGEWRSHRFTLAILAAALAVPLVQLIPLPPQVWTALPGRDQGALALEIAGIPAGWAPASVAPDMTWRSFLALLPATAVFLGVLSSSTPNRRRYVWVILGGAAASLVLGLLQAAFGDPFYTWPTTTRGLVSGLLANRNHFATLAVAALPFAAALMGGASRRSSTGRVAYWAAVALAVAAIVAVVVTRSRAGVALLGPSLLLSGLILWTAAGRGRPGKVLIATAAGLGAVLLVIGALGIGPILARFDTGAPSETRVERWPAVSDAAQAYLPTGAGFGSFERVYRSVEPLEEVDETSFNRAHNDYLETWLEGGWLSAGVLIAFLIWLFRRSRASWRASASTAADLGRAGSVAILMILLHSAVDYPLRTVALMAVLAVAAALLEASTHGSAQDVASAPRGTARRRRG